MVEEFPPDPGELPAQALAAWTLSNSGAGANDDGFQMGGNFAARFPSSLVCDDDRGQDIPQSVVATAAAGEGNQMTNDKFSDSFLAVRGEDRSNVSLEEDVGGTQGDSVIASSSFEMMSPSSDKDSVSLPSPEVPPPPLPANLPANVELPTEPPIPPPRLPAYANTGVVEVSARPVSLHSSPVPAPSAAVSLAREQSSPVSKSTTSAVTIPLRHVTTLAGAEVTSGTKSRFTVQPTSTNVADRFPPSVDNVFPLSFPSDDAAPPPLPPRRSFPLPPDMQKGFDGRTRHVGGADVMAHPVGLPSQFSSVHQQQQQQQQQHQLMRGTSLPAAATSSSSGRRIPFVEDTAPPPPPRRTLSRPFSTTSSVDPFAPIPMAPIASSVSMSKPQAVLTAATTASSLFLHSSGSAVVETTIAPLPRPRPRQSQTAVLVSSGEPASGPGTTSSGSSSPWQSINTPPIVDPVSFDPFSSVDPFAGSVSPDDPFATEPTLDAMLSDLGRDFDDADALTTTAFRTRAVTIGSSASSDVYEATSVHETLMSHELPHSSNADPTASPVVSNAAEPVGSTTTTSGLLVDLNAPDDNTDCDGEVNSGRVAKLQAFPSLDVVSDSKAAGAVAAASDFSLFGDLDVWYSSEGGGAVDWTSSLVPSGTVNSSASAAGVNSSDVISGSDFFDLSPSSNSAADKLGLDRQQAEKVSDVSESETSLFAVEPEGVLIGPHVVKTDLQSTSLFTMRACEPGVSITSQVIGDSRSVISLASHEPVTEPPGVSGSLQVMTDSENTSLATMCTPESGVTPGPYVTPEPGLSISPQVLLSSLIVVSTSGQGVSTSSHLLIEAPSALVNSPLAMTDSSKTSCHSSQSFGVASAAVKDLGDVANRSVRGVSEPPLTLSPQVVSSSVEHRAGNS